MTGLHVIECGPGTTVQDRGRLGFRRFGVPTAGFMDRTSAALANALVGNDPDRACVEFQVSGGRFAVMGGPFAVALAGPGCALGIGNRRVPENSSALAKPGDIISVGPVRSGVYAYLAVGGGFELPSAMGSLSVHLRSGIGGAALTCGDLLPVGSQHRGELLMAPPRATDTGPIRVVAGPQEERFAPGTLDLLCGEPFTVAADSDRMAYRLAGPLLEHAGGADIVSDGVLAGSIQVPGDGRPAILLRDCQTTGGYPKIATAISADLDRLAQTAPGGTLRFASVGLDEAVAAAREAHLRLCGLPATLKPAIHEPSTDTLLSVNLIDGATDGG